MPATLYGAKGGNTASDLYTIDPVTAVQTSVGPITDGTHGYAVTGLAFDPTDGTLYGISSVNSPNTPSPGARPGRILTIDTATGACTEINPLGLSPIAFSGRTAADICFDSSGQMWALPAPSGGGVGTRKLWKIDKTTGAVTVVGADCGFNFFGNGVVYRDSDDTLIAFPGGGTLSPPSSPFGEMYFLDPLVGFPATSTTTLTGGPFTDDAAVNAAALDDTGLIWAIEQDFSPGTWRLVTINAATGVETNVGTLADDFDALAWSPEPVTPPANDTCATATAITGISGSTSGTTAGAAKETPDALDAWFAITVDHTVFFKYTAPAAGYIEFTIDKPGGSTLNKMVAGVVTGACGAQSVYSDTLLGQEAVTDVTVFPQMIGHQVIGGDIVYVEIADDAGSPGHAAGAYTLAWSLRTIVTQDCPQDGQQVGIPIPGEDPIDTSSLVEALDYLQDSAGNHWVAYWKVDSGGPDEFHVAHAGPAAEAWTDDIVLSGAEVDAVPVPLVQLAYDGTHIWVMCLIRESGPDRVSAAVFEYGGGFWPEVTRLHGLSGNPDNSWTARLNAHPIDPGHAYVVFADEDGSTTETQIAKVDDTSALWSTTPLALYANALAITNGSGTPVLFFAPATNFATAGTELCMYAVDPSTGAVTLQQSVTYAELGQNSSAGTPALASFNLSTEPVTDVLDGASVYYLTVLWSLPIVPAFNIYRIRADGSTDFEWFELDSAKALAPYPPGFAFNGGVFPETNNVWVAESVHIAQFDRFCEEDWNLWPVAAFSPGGSLDTHAVVKIGATFWYALQFDIGTGPDQALAVGRVDIQRNGCFCELGPEISGSAGIYLDPQVIG